MDQRTAQYAFLNIGHIKAAVVDIYFKIDKKRRTSDNACTNVNEFLWSLA